MSSAFSNKHLAQALLVRSTAYAHTPERESSARRALAFAGKANAWADRMPHDRRAVVKLLRDKRDAAARNETYKPKGSINAGRIAAFDAAIALLEAAEERP